MSGNNSNYPQHRMMNSPKVSVIIPCYNYGRFLEQSVNSVRRQTYINWECLIIDDGSPDNTKEIAETLVRSDERIKYFYKTNGGLSSARNYGLDKAQGEMICFLDADDLIDENKLQMQLSCFQQNPLAEVVYGKAMFFENDLQKLYASKEKHGASELRDFSGSGNPLISLLCKGNITVISAPMIRKTVFKAAGNFDESYKSYEDWHFWVRCALAKQHFIYCDQPPVCTYIRFGHESMMSDKKKLLKAGIQLRKFLAITLPIKYRPYNWYRLLRTRIKLMIS